MQNLNRNSYISIQENAFENVVRKMPAILSRTQCGNGKSMVRQGDMTWTTDDSFHWSISASPGFSELNSLIKVFCKMHSPSSGWTARNRQQGSPCSLHWWLYWCRGCLRKTEQPRSGGNFLPLQTAGFPSWSSHGAAVPGTHEAIES